MSSGENEDLWRPRLSESERQRRKRVTDAAETARKRARPSTRRARRNRSSSMLFSCEGSLAVWSEATESNHRFPAETHSVIGQAVSFLVLFARDVGDAELKGSRELAAHPVQRIEPGTAAGVLAGHLLDDQFRVRINAERGGIEVERALQGLKKGSVFGHVVIVM